MENTCESDTSNPEKPFAFGFDYLVSQIDGQIYCVDINPADEESRPGPAGFFSIDNSKVKACVEKYKLIFSAPRCPEAVSRATLKKSEQIKFIPEPHCPETTVLDRATLFNLAYSFRHNPDHHQALAQALEPFVHEDIIIAKRDNTMQGTGVALINRQEALEKPLEIIRRLNIPDFPERVRQVLEGQPAILYGILAIYLLNQVGPSGESSWLNLLNSQIMLGTMAASVLSLFRALDKDSYNKFVLQSYIPPAPAELGPANRPACMRHLIHGCFNVDTGTISTMRELFVQRVGQAVDLQDLSDPATGVISHTRRTSYPVHSSPEESVRARTLSHQIIRNIFTGVYAKQDALTAKASLAT